MKPDLLLMQAFLGSTEKSLAEMCDVHRLFASSDRDAFFDSVAHRGRLGGAGMDVFANEPNVPSELWGMERVVLQPHRASATLETRADMGDLLVANLAAHFAGQALPAAVA